MTRTPSTALANDDIPYQYLPESIREFCMHDKLVSLIEVARFEGAKYTNEG